MEKQLSSSILGCFYAVYNELGFGYVESIYEAAMVIALQDAGIPVSTQVPMEVQFRDRFVGIFRMDMVVDRRVIVEIKAVSHLLPAHEVQLVNYLKGTNIPVGLLLNFGPKPRFRRRIFARNTASSI